MSDERQIPSDDGDATEDDGRIERLRELLTAPIKIPDSASGSGDTTRDAPGDAEDYPAPSVDIPPHVRAAAEAAAHAGDPDDAEDEQPRRNRISRKRRTWADAFLDTGRRDLAGAGGDAAAQLLTRLDELDRRTGEDVAGARARADEAAAAATSAQQDLDAARIEVRESHEETAARLDGVERRIAAAEEATEEGVGALRTASAAQRDEISRLTTSLDAAETTAAAAQRSAAEAREQAAGAARKAGTATIVAVVAVVLALAALGAALVL
ncbi:hypothetical protein [Myceligenerans indicum]|uniref:DUF3618 domain-containing protein n=1 Tax=Myceligenerans indicum TaxID=2593663 RepID=A0ABS1LRG7_9MICO|nr:hypothetical protein [Myceligenerans indicum]MBL0888876.1 hypothetical protein [Myceligenerans indicum]